MCGIYVVLLTYFSVVIREFMTSEVFKTQKYDNTFKYSIDYDVIKKSDGKEYMNIIKSCTDIDIPRGYFYFTNLFNGNEELASYITACNRADPNAEGCTAKSATAAIPHLLKGDSEYKIPNLLPLKIPKLDLKSGDNLQLTLTDVSIFGLEAITVEKLTIDPVKRHAAVTTKVGWLNVDSQYTIKGQILVLPISGNGPSNLTFYDCTFKYSMDYDLPKKNDGKEYIHIIKSDTDIDISSAYFHLTNLFNGNKQLGDHMNNFLNENSPEVVKDLGVPVLAQVIQEVVTQVLNAILKVVPYDEVLPL